MGTLFLSVSGDYKLKQAYVYDANSKAIYKDTNFSIGLSGENKWRAVYIGTSKDFIKLAVDWVSHNIYWTDPQYKWIMVQSLVGNSTSMYHVLIHENLDGPHALALDPIECLLFWSDIGTFTKIEVSSLSGRNRKSLISSNLMHPYSMAADYDTRRIYFVDSGRETVETVTYEGRDRNVLVKTSYSRYFDIAVYKDYLYVADTNNDRLYFFNKTNGKESYTSLFNNYMKYTGVTVFNPDVQPTPGIAHCTNYGCEHICVTEKDGANCLCKEGYIINQDKRTCSLNAEYFHRGLMYSNESSICIVDIRILTSFIFNPNCVLKINGTRYMVLDTDQRQIFIANNTAIYAAKVDNPVLYRLTTQSGILSGMSWDGYDRNLYWTEVDTGIIWRTSELSKITQIFMKDLKRPRDVIVLQHERLILWISDRNGSTLESSKMDGSSHQVVLNYADQTNLSSISYDPYGKRIFFFVASLVQRNYIVSCKPDGSNRNTFYITSKFIEKMEIYKGHMLFTVNGESGTELTTMSIDLMTVSTSGVLSGVGNISSIKVFDENLRQNETGPCFTLNGECEQICIANGKWRTCECTYGFQLEENGKTCRSDPVKDNFILIPDTTHNAIYQMSLTNQSLQGISSEQTSYLTGVTYSPVDDLVIWGTYDFEILIMHLNGTGNNIFQVQAISEDSTAYAVRLAVDYSTGNIYYTAFNYMLSYSSSSTINVISPEGKQRILVKGLDYPYGLVVYPSKGRMFYTESQGKSHVGQASMDGSQSTVVLDLSNDWPRDLVIDYRTDNLYWIDYWDDSIEVCNLDGTNRKKLFKLTDDISISGLALYRDYIFISTLEHSHMLQLKISNPNETSIFATVKELGTIQGINIYSSTNHDRNKLCSSVNGGCSTFCFPTPDASVCGCEEGVDLKKGNNKECSNKNDRGLIVTVFEGNNQHLSTVAIDSDGTPRLDNMPSSYFPIDVDILSIQGDYTLHQAYMYDRYTQSIYRDSNFSIGLSRKNIWTTLHRGLSKDYVKLAVDWISHNIYWTDPQYKWIVVQSLLGNDTSMHRVLIHDNLDGPHALALDPFQALLFWSDVGKFTKIEVSSLSGSNRKILAFSNLLHPYSITADCAYKQLYFIDVGRQTLETVSYEGKDRKVVFKQTYSYFFGLAVFKDYLYVTDTNYDKLYFLNKTDGKELQKSLYKDEVKYFVVTVFHPDAQNATTKGMYLSHCVSYGCDHICVTKKDGATCLCKDGYTLNQDMRTCSLSSDFFHRGLMFSNKSSICIVDIRVVTHFSYNPNCVLKINNTLYMVLDTDDREIILANNTGVYSARVDDFQLRLMTELSGTISGLAWDGYDRILYWTENNTGRIWRLSRESETAQVFLEDLKNPRDILILPHERLVYWISDRNGSTIESSSMDRSNHQIVLNSADLENPRSLSYDPQTKRIYFLSNPSVGPNYIRYCHLNGSRLETFVSTNKHLENLEIYKGHLLVTAKDDLGTLIMSYSIDMSSFTTSGIFENTGNITAIKVFDENFRQNETGPCFALNGDCEQICISKGKSRICECTFGFRLSANGKTCTSDPINDNFMLVIDYTHNDIYQINLTDQSVQGINVQGNFPRKALTYSPVSGQVIWGTDDSKISMMYLNGTGKKLLPLPTKNNENITPNRFAVDYSTGNIYYTGFSGEYFIRIERFIGIISPDGKHRVLITGLDEPLGLVVYPSKGLLFYTNTGFNSHLGQANMDGSQSAVLIDSASTWLGDLTVDYKSDYLYWITYWSDIVEYCKLDGTNYNTLTRFQDELLNGIAFFQDYLFISTDGHSDNIIQLKISNPDETVAFASHGELGTIGYIEIYSSAVQNRNTFCSVNNGGCSTFCFPVPGGGICGCEDGVDLKEGSKTVCSNIQETMSAGLQSEVHPAAIAKKHNVAIWREEIAGGSDVCTGYSNECTFQCRGRRGVFSS
ncbi:hypothetical protein ACJMK2_003304 [Sinanodonta woodiana]|uniref:EGF-like domain-containing protein n=1 Tax=Sinanodonta woodiana TaxID=1069815 RepID=A0ABD3XZI5_SINWO